MKTKFSGILTLLLAFVVQVSLAQTTVSGTVTEENGPLPGANVIVKGTSTGTQTDFDGNYSIQASPTDVLIFSFVGFTTKEITVGNQTTINVGLAADNALDEVIVTAQGVKREKKALGYAVSVVKEEAIENRPEADIARTLRGKAAGVNITASNGLTGSSTNITIRGYSSITGSNQPLFVVDGVPFDSGTNDQSNFLDGSNASSRFLDLDPNNIASVNVLKGLAATVTYGEEGRNGVILITTKAGSTGGAARNKSEISISQSIFLSEAILPDYQTNFGGGFNQDFGYFFSNWGSRFTDTDPALYGNRYRGQAGDQVILNHPFNFLADQSLVAGFEDLLDSDYIYQNYNGVEEFFRTGVVNSTSINIKGGKDNTSFNLSYGRLEDEGITPGNALTRNTFSIGGRTKLSNNFTASGTLNLTVTDYKSPPVAASFGSGTAFDGGSVFGDLLYTPRSVDLTNLPSESIDGRSVYYRAGNDIQNPYWTVNNVKTAQLTNRVFGNLRLQYDITDWFNIAYRVGIDRYFENSSYGQNRGGVDGDITGLYRTTNILNTIYDHNLSLNFNRPLNDDFTISGVLAATARRDTFERDGLESTNQLIPGILNHYNFTAPSSSNSFTGALFDFEQELNRTGVYADVSLDYKNYLYLNLSARNDFSSAVESGNNSILYPGVSASFIPTSAFDISNDVLNYLKFRVGYGSSASFPSPYNTRSTLNLVARDLVALDGSIISSNSTSNVLGNANLKPERVTEVELGIDSRLFNNRLGLNLSVFKKTTTDLITSQTLPSETGFTSSTTNIGEIENQGIELEYDLSLFKNANNGFRWNVSGNFYADENIVTDLAEGTDNILLTSAVIGQAANYAVEGKPFGLLLGTTILRDVNGNAVVGGDGLYIEDTNISEIGDPNADWTTNMVNTFSYKNFRLSFDIQYRHGGDIFSTTAAALIGRGVVDADNPINRYAGYVLPGVLQDGSVNNIAISSTELGFNTYFGGPNELSIFDGSTLRLNELSLGYSIPASILEKTPFGSLDLSVSGSNLWYKAFNFPDDINYDTNSSSTGVGNGQGIDFITGPSTRRFGFTVKTTF